jgi:hypothetical protein
MRKTFGITKYESRWQLLRASIKGKYNDDLSYKFSLVLSYFKEDLSYNRWERVFNWTEGLLRGLKDEDKRIHTATFLDELNQLKPCVNVIDDISENYSVLFNADINAAHNIAAWGVAVNTPEKNNMFCSLHPC